MQDVFCNLKLTGLASSLCNALGVDLKGPLGSLMTSRIILTAVGAKVGW